MHKFDRRRQLASATLVLAVLWVITPALAQLSRTFMPGTGVEPTFRIENTPCCNTTGSTAAASETETKALAIAGNRVVRNGKQLRLRLDGNRSLTITSCDEEKPDCDGFSRWRSYRFVTYWPAQHYYVVEVGFYEGAGAYLISETDGQVTYVYAPPVISPSGHYAIANDVGGYGQGLQLIDLRSLLPVVRELSLPTCSDRKPGESVRKTPVWVDDSHVKFEGLSFPYGPTNSIELLKVSDGKAEWEC